MVPSTTPIRKGYSQIDPDDYAFSVDQEDLDYVWEWFQEVRQLYERAAQAARFVLFTSNL